MKEFDLVAWVYELVNSGDYPKLAGLVIKYLNPKTNQLFLDLGGGTGTIANIAAIKTDCRFKVIDSSGGMISEGRKKNRAISFLKNDITEGLKFPDRSIDGIIMIYALHHIEKRFHEKVLKDIKRVLKDDASILFIEMDDHNFVSWVKGLIEKIMTFGRLWYRNPKELSEILSGLGFITDYRRENQGYSLLAKKR